MSFKQDIQSVFAKKDDDGVSHFTAQVSSNWGINHVPNGGYLMALLSNALLSTTEKNALVHITANFLARTKPAAVDMQTSIISQSRQFERYQASMFQGDKETIRAMAIVKEQHEVDSHYYEYEAPDVKPRHKCQRMMGMPSYSLFSNVDMYLEEDSTSYLRSKKLHKAEHRGWVRLANNEEWCTSSLCLAADGFPPPILSFRGMSPWVPTLEMSIQIRQMPTSQWLKCVFHTRFLTGEIMEEDGELWDEDGNLIAISRQLASYRPVDVPARQKFSMKMFERMMRLRNYLFKSKA